ncbi:uncharacterized protein EI97DRAFT_444122 [Westerdykella ornata]|uniref:Uncharacterized protein n=1 Tax=Westerdykella ornata TaxID=318751 RepID=A0A6A6JCM2_WESOR|nr:uncharacterized protein EI97DRAFT_444122 [Westerdykella ornata]KAF2274370.1 hypothetical protein EI97DRAFT_444122 [Westerdykella ornata]
MRTRIFFLTYSYTNGRQSLNLDSRSFFPFCGIAAACPKTTLPDHRLAHHGASKPSSSRISSILHNFQYLGSRQLNKSKLDSFNITCAAPRPSASPSSTSPTSRPFETVTSAINNAESPTTTPAASRTSRQPGRMLVAPERSPSPPAYGTKPYENPISTIVKRKHSDSIDGKQYYKHGRETHTLEHVASTRRE